ncbi:MAG: hypothetical protein V7634_284, partial [Bradyrhizobium sp.]
MDVADAKSSGEKAGTASQPSQDDKAVVVATAPAGDAIVTSVHRPGPGSISVVEVPPGAHLKLDFASTDVKVAVLDVDLVMLFPDGAKIILPGYAFNLVGQESTDANFADKVVSPQQLLAAVDELHLLNDDNAALLGSGTKRDPQNQDQGKDQNEAKAAVEDAPPAPPPQPAAPTAKVAAVADFQKPPEQPADRSFKRPPGDDLIVASSGSPPAQRHASDAAPNLNTSTDTGNGNGDGNVSAANLSIKLLGVSGDKVSALGSGGVQILGAASEIPATTDPAFSVQQQMRTLTGTAQNDII